MKDYTVSEIIEIFLENHKDIWNDMRMCEHGYKGDQPNIHHLEGSIWTHTMMVLKQAEDYSTTIKLAALCHDLGKPYVYEDRDEQQRRRFKCHEAVSTFYAREVLRSFDLDYSETERILELVAQHGSLYNYFDDGRIPRNNMYKIVDKFSSDVFADLIKLYKCDHNGRFYTNESNNDELIYQDFQDILKLMEIEEKFELANRETKIIRGLLTVLVGPPRSGKSTWVKSRVVNSNTVVISRDDLVMKYGVGNGYSEKWKSLSDETQKKIDSELQSNFSLALKENKGIIIDMTNMSKKSRKKWLNPADGYFKQAIVFIESKSVLLSRNTEDKTIPEFVIDSMMKSFVWPNKEEFKKVRMYHG